MPTEFVPAKDLRLTITKGLPYSPLKLPIDILPIRVKYPDWIERGAREAAAVFTLDPNSDLDWYFWRNTLSGRQREGSD